MSSRLEQTVREVVPMKSVRASQTSVFVCQGRAVADGRLAPGRFADPVARRLLDDRELAVVDLVRAGGLEELRGNERLTAEAVRACAEIVVPRTVAIDDVVTDASRSEGHGQVVLLGAGLDARPWRLAALGSATVFSVDHPATQADTRSRARTLTPCVRSLVLVGVDLASSPLGEALAGVGHDARRPTTWVWEGVVPYLRREDVVATVAALAERSAPGSRLAVSYQEPSRVASIGRRLSGLLARLSGAYQPTRDEPWRSAWTAPAMAALLTEHGLLVDSDRSLLEIAQDLDSPTRHSRSLTNGRLAVATKVGPAGPT